MKSRDILLLGCGDIGTALGMEQLRRGHRPLAIRRTISPLPAELPGLSLDYTDPVSLARLSKQPCDVAVLTPTPPGRDPEAYRKGYLLPVQNLLALWRDAPPRRLIYVSSTRVYGDADGDWVVENSPLKPQDAQAEILCEAEALLLQSHHDVSVVRFSGIYGRLPSRLLERIRGGDICMASPPHYSNRIHRDDCIGFLLHLMELQSWQDVYLASDDAPALQFEVESWLAERLGVQEPRQTVAPPLANRRCCNRRMRETGYQLRFPDYRAGYSEIISSTSMSAPFGNAAT